MRWLGKIESNIDRATPFPVEAQMGFDTTFRVGTVYFLRRMRITTSEPASSVMALIARLGSISGVGWP
jgi:hypothetical protein